MSAKLSKQQFSFAPCLGESLHVRNSEPGSHSTAGMAIPSSGSTAKQSNTTPTSFCSSRYFLSLLLARFRARSTHFSSPRSTAQNKCCQLNSLGSADPSPHKWGLHPSSWGPQPACPTPSAPFHSKHKADTDCPTNTSLLPLKLLSKPEFHLLKNKTKPVPPNHLKLPTPRLHWFHLSPSKAKWWTTISLQDEESTFYPHLNLF